MATLPGNVGFIGYWRLGMQVISVTVTITSKFRQVMTSRKFNKKNKLHKYSFMDAQNMEWGTRYNPFIFIGKNFEVMVTVTVFPPGGNFKAMVTVIKIVRWRLVLSEAWSLRAIIIAVYSKTPSP